MGKAICWRDEETEGIKAIDAQGKQITALKPQLRLVSLNLFDDVSEAERDTSSHAALVGNQLYVRNGLKIYCLLLE